MRVIIVFCLCVLTVCGTGCKKEQLHWQKVVNIESHTTSRLNRIAFLDNSTCVIGGGEKFLKAEVLVSHDGGNTWTVNDFPEAGKGMYGIGVAPNGSVYLSGFDGKIIYSDDATQNWKTSQIPDWRYYVAIAYPTNELGVYIATATLGSGTIVRINNNFEILDTTGYGFALNDISFPTSTIGYACGYGGIVKTTDQGNSWKMLDVKNDNFKAIHAVNENNIWVCGYNGGIYHTTDGGTNWKQVRNGNKITKAKYHLNDIVFKDEQNGWAVGENGIVIYTDDGGISWKQYESFTDTHFLNMAIMPDGNLLVIGEKGTIYKLYQ